MGARLLDLLEAWADLSLRTRRLISIGLPVGAGFLLVIVLIIASSGAAAPAPSPSPSPSSGVAAAPTPTPTPTCDTGAVINLRASPAPDGNQCVYVSGFVASTTNGQRTPVSGAIISASLGSLDSGAGLPVATELKATSDQSGAFSFPGLLTSASWRILYGVQRIPTEPIVPTVITIAKAVGPNDFDAHDFPDCGSATPLSPDASFHFAGDARFILRITPCPDGTVLAFVQNLPIVRQVDIPPTPTPEANALLSTINLTDRLVYDTRIADAYRIQQAGNTTLDTGTLIFLAVGVLGFLIFLSAAFWIFFRLHGLEGSTNVGDD